jgi:mRNA interferase RelE/StbE
VDKFHVILIPAALKFYKTCTPELAKQLNKCFNELEKNPFFGRNIKLLQGQSSEKRYRYRIGDYRVIYFVDKQSKNVVITLISARPSAYRNLIQ